MALELITGLGENTHAICEAIARQLSAELGETVTWNNASTWDELQARLQRGDVQMGWICGLLYTALKPVVNALEIKNLNFFYGSFQGLKNINLNILERRVTAFIGPSGCGKSTLLRTLNRMYDLYPGQRAEGEINFYGELIS